MTRYFIQKRCTSCWPTLHVSRWYIGALIWCRRYEKKNKGCALRIVQSTSSK